MLEAVPADPVLRIVGVLWADEEARDGAEAALAERWGPIGWRGPDRPFDRTDYYLAEMGPNLRRRLIAFEELIAPEKLVEAKWLCQEVEAAWRGPKGRRVNLDAGYLEHNKVVLASLKYAGQKIYLGKGIYADPILKYRQGFYQPFEWTFPDFKDGRYDEELGVFREQYLLRRRAWKGRDHRPEPPQ